MTAKIKEAGFSERASHTGDEHTRIELRVTATDVFVAWFCVIRKDKKANVSGQIVYRDELSVEQQRIAEAWLREKVATHI